ncbi:MAG: cbb3-type cytochrome c oxidase subunit II [Parachlamydiaceae bacterium]
MNFQKIELSAVLTILGIIFLFSFSVAIVLIAPNSIDKSWTEPTSSYQVQMYEVSDPHVYLSSEVYGGQNVQYVYHLKEGFTLLSFRETETFRIKAPPELEKYVTKSNDKTLKLTSRLLLLRPSSKESTGDYQAFELYDPNKKEAFTLGSSDPILENWVDENFLVLDPVEDYHKLPGVIYVSNPREYKVVPYEYGEEKGYRYDPDGEPVKSLEELKGKGLGFLSRKELISMGEKIYAEQGCWYCHTDQTRTLIQDVVLNGSDSFPAPPSSANEYIYQSITFPGTKRNGPDLSRTGVKRPSRDWHKSHFWAPKTQSKGSIMPSFRHFFDFDPRGTSRIEMGVPNQRFEAIFQYLMTKGTRITPPNQAWWLGKDPLNTKAIIEGRKKL